MTQSSRALFHQWQPRHGVAFLVASMIGLAMLVAIVFGLTARAYAQGATLTASPAFDYKAMLTMIVPAIWASVGPLVIAAITKGMNGLGQYVPRPLQVILSAVFGAMGGALADGGVTAAVTAATGIASQAYAQAPPAALLTEKKP